MEVEAAYTLVLYQVVRWLEHNVDPKKSSSRGWGEEAEGGSCQGTIATSTRRSTRNSRWSQSRSSPPRGARNGPCHKAGLHCRPRRLRAAAALGMAPAAKPASGPAPPPRSRPPVASNVAAAASRARHL
ncbi:hypothetical protein ACP4OV_002110 [Aristida adscensionis]